MKKSRIFLNNLYFFYAHFIEKNMSNIEKKQKKDELPPPGDFIGNPFPKLTKNFENNYSLLINSLKKNEKKILYSLGFQNLERLNIDLSDFLKIIRDVNPGELIDIKTLEKNFLDVSENQKEINQNQTLEAANIFKNLIFLKNAPINFFKNLESSFDGQEAINFLSTKFNSLDENEKNLFLSIKKENFEILKIDFDKFLNLAKNQNPGKIINEKVSKIIYSKNSKYSENQISQILNTAEDLVDKINEFQRINLDSKKDKKINKLNQIETSNENFAGLKKKVKNDLKNLDITTKEFKEMINDEFYEEKIEDKALIKRFNFFKDTNTTFEENTKSQEMITTIQQSEKNLVNEIKNFIKSLPPKTSNFQIESIEKAKINQKEQNTKLQ